jgi:hypothetical protein
MDYVRIPLPDQGAQSQAAGRHAQDRLPAMHGVQTHTRIARKHFRIAGQVSDGHIVPSFREPIGKIDDLSLCPSKLQAGGDEQNSHELPARFADTAL